MRRRARAAAVGIFLALAAGASAAGNAGAELPLKNGFDKVRWSDTRQAVREKYKGIIPYGGESDPDGSISTTCISPAEGKMCLMASIKFDGAKPKSHVTQIVLLLRPVPPDYLGTQAGLEAAWRLIQTKLGLPPERPTHEVLGTVVGGVTVDVLGADGDFGIVIHNPKASGKR